MVDKNSILSIYNGRKVFLAQTTNSPISINGRKVFLAQTTRSPIFINGRNYS